MRRMQMPERSCSIRRSGRGCMACCTRVGEGPSSCLFKPRAWHTQGCSIRDEMQEPDALPLINSTARLPQLSMPFLAFRSSRIPARMGWSRRMQEPLCLPASVPLPSPFSSPFLLLLLLLSPPGLPPSNLQIKLPQCDFQLASQFDSTDRGAMIGCPKASLQSTYSPNLESGQAEAFNSHHTTTSATRAGAHMHTYTNILPREQGGQGTLRLLLPCPLHHVPGGSRQERVRLPARPALVWREHSQSAPRAPASDLPNAHLPRVCCSAPVPQVCTGDGWSDDIARCLS